MEVVFLGTSSMVPTAERNHSAILLSYKNEGILLDCGEGTQRQLRIAKIRPTKITKILISHWHGDHILGLPGLIQTLGVNEYNKVLEVYGPEGTKDYLNKMFNSFVMEARVRIKVTDVKQGVFYEDDNFCLEAIPARHTARCMAYSFVEKEKRRMDMAYLKKFGLQKDPILRKLQQGKDIEWKGKKIKADKATIVKKGKKIVYITDTMHCENLVKIAKDADLLICEATLSSKLKEKAARIKHMASCDAADVAKKAKVKKLILTHFSQRYKSVSELKKEARKIFPNTDTAKDFMKVEV